MKNWSLFLSFLLIGCQEVSQNSNSTKTEEEKVEKPAITEKLDSPKVDSPKVEKTPEVVFNPNKNSAQIKALLENPIDLFAFKKAMKSSNSGVHNRLDYFFKPDTKGFYYGYFLFRKCALPESLEIVVYKEGTEIGEWEDENEQLITIETRCELKELKKLDLVGKSFDEIKTKFGENYITNGSYIIYAEKGNLLILKFSGFKKKHVSQLKYLKTNLNIKTFSDLPSSIFNGFS